MVFNMFPSDPKLYNEDLCHIVSNTIERYGKDEWLAGILTTDMHGHLGIYAIVGVKMGIRALEYLGVKAGDVSVISSAGVKPPVSCMNDGLQVSAGATLGHGLIHSAPTNTPLTEAIFSTEKQSIQIKLKNNISDMIKGEIAGAVEKHGHSPKYWEYVRKLAIRYWLELDRDEIFEISEH